MKNGNEKADRPEHQRAAELAGEARLHSETIGRLEQGTENVTIDTLQSIADAMQVTLDSLLAPRR